MKTTLKRILYTLFIIFIYKIGMSIPIPFINVDLSSQFNNYLFFDIFNIAGGGLIQSFSLFALGVTPFVTSSIIIQMISNNNFRYFDKLNKSGERGQEQITQITRYLSLIFGFGSALTISTSMNMFTNGKLIQQGHFKVIYVSMILTIGSFVLTWLADQINKKGIGNGISIIIASGIIFNLLPNILNLKNSIDNFDGNKYFIITLVILISIFMILLTLLFQKMITKNIKIQFTRTKMYEENSYLPLKVNSSGVVPIIISGTVLSIPFLISDLLQKLYPNFKELHFLKFIDSETTTGIIVSVILTTVFTFIYALSQVKPNKIIYSLNLSNAYIFNTDFDLEAEYFLIKKINKLSILSCVFLNLSIVIPFVLTKLYNLPPFLTFGGTSLIILINVICDVATQIKNINFNYKFEF